jgi:hypothetical protein
VGNGDIRVKEAIGDLGLYVGISDYSVGEGLGFGRILQRKFGIQIRRFAIFKASIIWKVECTLRVSI